MKQLSLTLIASCYLSLSLAYGGDQIGTVTAAGPFKLAGTPVPVSATRSLPLMSEDSVTTTDFPATTLLRNGSLIVVEKNSSASIEHVGKTVVVILHDGSLGFKAVEGSNLVVTALRRKIELQSPSQGRLQITSPDEVKVDVEKGTPPVVVADESSTSGTTEEKSSSTKKRAAVVIVAAGTAAATGLGLAILSDDSGSGLPARSQSTP